MPTNDIQIAYGATDYLQVRNVPQDDANLIQHMLYCLKAGMSMEKIAESLDMGRSTLHERLRDWTQKGFILEVQKAMMREQALIATTINGIVLDSWHDILSALVDDALSKNTSAKTRLEIGIFLKTEFITPITTFTEDPGTQEQRYMEGHSGNFNPTQIPAQT